jgi:hypothetical protein
MIEIRYAEREGIEICGTCDDIQRVKQQIQAFLHTDTDTLLIEALSNADPSPYDLIIAKLLVKKGQGPTKVSLEQHSVLEVSGGLDNLEAFVSFFEFDIEAASGEHRHYEYYEGNQWIDKNSESVVIAVK